jgi:hypothetical protein
MEFRTNKQGERDIRMDTRNEMCRANNEERTTGYAN